MGSIPVACGDGSPALVWVIILAALAAWVVVTALIIRTAGDRTERRLLLGLLVGSIVLGPLIVAAYYDGFVGDDTSTAKLALLLAIPGLIGAAIAHFTGAANRLRAFVLSTWGAVFLVGAGIFTFLVAVVVGGACIE